MNNKLIILLLILCLLPAVLPFFHPALTNQTDLVLNIGRLAEFDRVLQDGQLLPLWAPDYDGGYGNPVFMFYSPLFFFSSEIFRLLGFSYLNCVKIVVILSIIFSGVAMFIFTREFWGKAGGFLSAMAYIYAPYHLGDVYARTAFSENMAFIWMPLILWSFYKLIREKKIVYLVFGSLTFASLVLTHNIMTMLFTPVLILYIGLIILLNKDYSTWKSSLAAFLLGLGLSAFFWIPALIEMKYTIFSCFLSGYFDFHKHFISLGNFFFSEPEKYGTLSFQIGPILMLLMFLSLGIALAMSNAKENRERKYSIIFFLSLIPLYIFFMLPVSKWIWESVLLLAFVQFPWRLSALLVLSLSFVSGAAIFFAGEKEMSRNQVIMAAIFSLLLIVTNLSYVKLKGDITAIPDEQFAPEMIKSVVKYVKNYDTKRMEPAPIDYRPKWAQKLTGRVIDDRDKLEVISGDIKIKYSNIKTSSYFFNLAANKDSQARIHTYWFPGWRAYLDGKEASIDYSNEHGLMDIQIPAGEHKLEVKLGDTPLRLAAKIISLVSLVILLIVSRSHLRNILNLNKLWR